MDQLILLVNDLQKALNTIEGHVVDLPQIVVVGCQSSGKSSVLESIVGYDLLPRGSGIVTRRPLTLQMIHTGEGEEQYGEFGHKKGEKFKNFNAIRDEIQAETDRTTGNNRNVSNHPITLTIRSKNVPTLTMVDLPGLTKVATEGQDPKIVGMIRDMVLQYITPKNALILAVTPGNTDLANSDSLQISQEVDPQGDRTIGVITKLDIMDAGTDASSILRNEIRPLKLGYYGVVNRSQLDIDEKKTMEDSQNKEKMFFETSPAYRYLIDKCGTNVLSKTLTRLLSNHIKKELPELTKKIDALIEDKKRELERYGKSPEERMLNTNELILTIIAEYVKGFESLIAGKVGSQVEDDLKGGARITRIFGDVFLKDMDAVPSISQMEISKVKIMIRNHAGINVPIYVPHQCFESIIRRQLELLRDPSMKAISLASDEILNIHAQVSFSDLERYPSIKDAIRNVVEDLVNSCVEPCRFYVNQLIDNEQTFVNTSRCDFRGACVLWERKQKNAIPLKKNKEELLNDYASQLISYCSSYFDRIREQISDLVPKTIILMLVEGSTKPLLETLNKKIFGSGMLNDLMKEDPRTTSNRKKCNEVLGVLLEAKELLNKVRIFNI